MGIKSFLQRSGLSTIIKPPQVQRVEQVERIHQEKQNVDYEKLRLENDKFEADLQYKKALLQQKEQERLDKDRQHQEKLEQEQKLADKKEQHEIKILNKKHEHEDRLKEEDRKNAVEIEKIKGTNTKEIITHESDTRVTEKELTERFLESENDRNKVESQAKARDDAMAEVIKIMAKGAEDRKTITLQAKLGQGDVGKEKIQGWIEQNDDRGDE